ncbi:MAG: putative Glutathione S-transferase [Panacagrimonas sp.]|jgi:glutathione S-transferase|nr:glutathione S-transferase family protein [Panacagrimonas sp.]MCC2658657.1 putative Glutathione S-transferase [Panacagrimonas sp.]
MKFYDCSMAPSPRRVRIFLAEKGVKIDTVQVDLMSGENLKPEFLKINPRGIVPVLQLDDGTCIDEAVPICRYIEELHPDPPLMGTDARSRAVIAMRTRHMEWDGFLSAAEAFRNSTPAFADRGIPGQVGVKAIPALAERGRAGLARFFDNLEKTLAQSQFIAGDRYTIADITGLCVVDFAGWMKIQPTDSHPNVQRWYRSVSSRPSAAA